MPRRARWRRFGAVVIVVAVIVALAVAARDPHRWSPVDVATLRSLWIGALPALPPDPSNRVADDSRAAALGRRLFFDPRFSVDGTVACASCHEPASNFTDLRARARGVGEVPRRTMTIVGVAYSPWFFWDGRKDSLWSQALGPLESPDEHGGDRTAYAHTVAGRYRLAYEEIFGVLPDLEDTSRFPPSAGPHGSQVARAAWNAMAPDDRASVTTVFVNMGKAIAAFERTLVPEPTRFDRYVEALLAGNRSVMAGALSHAEVAGLRLFIGEAGCVSCHSGPLFTNHEFHNTGVPQPADLPADRGRAAGVHHALADAFNCMGAFSDAPPDACGELRFVKAHGHELERAFKVPTLRGVARTPPYMHAGQFVHLRTVLEHYNEAPESPAGHTELAPLNLSARELEHVEAFLGSLLSDSGSARR